MFTPGKKISAVRVIINHNGCSYRKAIGISCPVASWSTKKQRCSDLEKDNYIRRIRCRLEKYLDDFSTPETIRSVLEWAVSPDPREYTPPSTKKRSVPSFWDYFKIWSMRPVKSQSVRDYHYRLVMDLMGNEDNWDDIDSSFYLRLTRAMEEQGFRKNTIATISTSVKSVMKEGLKLKYHNNLSFNDFKIETEDIDAVYLTEEELDRLWKIDGLSEGQQKCRDLFLIGVYTASRRSDCSKFSTENFDGQMFRYTQQKTGYSVVMPLNPKVRLLIERNGGHAPAIASYNRTIKKVCRKARIDSLVEITRTEGARSVTTRDVKWKFVSSHTARRTGATLLYLSGVPMKQCMFITGHTTEANFMKYIKISKEENAFNLVDNPFFR